MLYLKNLKRRFSFNIDFFLSVAALLGLIMKNDRFILNVQGKACALACVFPLLNIYLILF